MKILCLVCIIVFLFASFGVFGQGTYLEKGISGFGAGLRTMVSPQAFKGVGFSTGYSIAGILDIGFSLDFTLGEISGNDASELAFGFDYNVNVLKQSNNIPLSVQINGTYQLTSVYSDYLENIDRQRRATGYIIGLDLARSFRLTSYWLLRLNALADYRSFTYNITDTSAAPPVVVDQERISTLSWGGGLGFLFVFPKGQTLALMAEVRADQDLDLEIRPILAAAFPQK